jgi:hypothetical protein
MEEGSHREYTVAFAKTNQLSIITLLDKPRQMNSEVFR